MLGFDNAHAVKPPKKFKFSGKRFAYDHKHRNISDTGVPYEFQDAQQLLIDFFADVDVFLKERLKMKSLAIGIMSQEKMRERVLAIARGEIKPKSSDPKIWFTSIRSLAEVLSDDNRGLLRVIQERKPDSVSSLAEIAGRKVGLKKELLNW